MDQRGHLNIGQDTPSTQRGKVDITRRLESEMEQPNHSFSEETLESLVELGSVLEKIHRRLVSEGYEIKDGNAKM